MKKLISMLLTLTLLAALSVPVLAENPIQAAADAREAAYAQAVAAYQDQIAAKEDAYVKAVNAYSAQAAAKADAEAAAIVAAGNAAHAAQLAQNDAIAAYAQSLRDDHHVL